MSDGGSGCSSSSSGSDGGSSSGNGSGVMMGLCQPVVVVWATVGYCSGNFRLPVCSLSSQ
jgi:hypothetical protein